MKKAIVTQIHIPQYDLQGGIQWDEKRELLELSVKHLRQQNPKTTIILCGHGYCEPSKRTIKDCDEILWETPCLPLDNRGCVIGQPAQFKSVYQGIKRAKELGFNEVFKTRGDSIIGLPNICNISHKIIEDEGKDLLLSQQTASKRFKMGDCWQHGDIDTLCDIWNENNEVQCSVDGVVNTGMNWLKYHLGLNPNEISEVDWIKYLKYYCSFRDVCTLKIADLRWNWHELKLYKKDILDNTLDYSKYYWGQKNGWHSYSKDCEDLIKFDGTTFTRKTFYD